MKRSLGSRFLFVTVFSLVLSLATGTVAGQTANLLYSFSGQDDGGHPQAVLIMDSSGNQYGTTSKGGTYNHGTVFELASSSGSYSEKVLYSFTNSNGDGAQPQAGLITDSSGNLYGTTYFGGADGYGTVYELVNSSGSYTERVLYSFAGQGDGTWPAAGLTMDSSGNLYGTTQGGGAQGWGAVFELLNSSGSYSERLLYSFNGGGDGALPQAGVILDSSGNLYGTTPYSHGNAVGNGYGNGSVFELVNSSGSYTERVLYSFTGANGDGAHPQAGLIMDSSGNLYGTTYQGGTIGWGTVFELANSSGSYSEKVLYSFTNSTDGAFPIAGLIMDPSGNLYGTNSGPNTVPAGGSVFELENSSGSYSVIVLLDFADTCGGPAVGGNPNAGLTMDSLGNLYGTAFNGGKYNYGAVFSLTHLSGPATATTTSVVSSSNPANAGFPLTFTATIGPSLTVRTGTVTFSGGGTVLGTSPVDFCGTAGFTFEDAASLGIGTYTVTAQYNPVLPGLAASLGTLNQTVYEAGVVLTNGNNTLTGNETVNGNVGATTFVGNGSGLTNVLASGLSCTFCIGNSQLAVNYAASASQGGPASNALMFGGLLPTAFQPAGSYATTGANFFIGNQSVTGNLSASGHSATTGTTTMGPTGTPIVQHLSMNFNPSFGSVAGGCTSQSFAFPGVNDGDTVALGIPNKRMPSADVMYTAWASAANTVTIRACVLSENQESFGSGTIRVDVWQH
jgi:uncharacterized repeat protein (TIGR03803 family)